MVIPTEITSGLSVRFQLSFPQYSASLWQATLYLRSVTGSAEIQAVPVGEAFEFSATAAQTQQWPAGRYRIVIRVSDGIEVFQPFSGRLTVMPDLTTAESVDPRSEAEISLAAIRATLANRASSDQLKLSFGGRSLEKMPLSDLLRLEQRYLSRVNQEKRRAAGRGLLSIHKMRMH